MSLAQIGPPFLTSSSLGQETMRLREQKKLKAQGSELIAGPVPRKKKKERGGGGEHMTDAHIEST